MRVALILALTLMAGCTEQMVVDDATVEDASTWACNPVDNAGCDAGETCRVVADAWEPACVPAGTLEESETRCRVEMEDRCGPGLFCTGGSNVCRAYCDPNGAACGAGRYCSTILFSALFEATGLGACLEEVMAR